MKKAIIAFVFATGLVGRVFAQEYTIYLNGSINGFISVQKERNGKITITPHIKGDDYSADVWIGKAICPILPEDGFSATQYTKSIVIDGNTTTETSLDGSWDKTVVKGNKTTKTISRVGRSSVGRITKTISGNTLTTIYVAGSSWDKMVLNDNTLTRASSWGEWDRIVVTGNTLTQTDSNGSWAKVVINGNTTTITGNGVIAPYTSANLVYLTEGEEVIRGNTRTRTYTKDDGGNKNEKSLHGGYSNGGGYNEVVDGNTITITSLDGKSKTVVDKRGNDIFITITGYCSYLYDIGVSEKTRYQNIIDAITSGNIKEVKEEFFDYLITYYF